MSDPATPDFEAYAELLKAKTEGRAFYHPRAEGVIGDCGIITGGLFVKLFNCFVDGIGGDILPTSTPDPGRIPSLSDLASSPVEFNSSERSLQILSNKGVCWRVHKGQDWSVELGMSTGSIPGLIPSSIGFGFKASHTFGAAAFLVPGGPVRRVELLLQNMLFPPYLARHHRDIRARFPAYDTRTIYMIEGSTYAASWCRGLARRHGSEIEGYVNISPMTGLPEVQISNSKGEKIDHPWSIESGPVFQPPDGRLQLISAKLIIKRTKIADKLRLTSKVTMPVQHDTCLNTGGNERGPRTTVGPSHLPHSQDHSLTDPGSSSSGSLHREAGTPLSDDSREVQTHPQHFDSSGDVSAASSLSDISSIDYTPDPLNEIEVLLDAALAAHPQYEAIVVRSSVMETFWANLSPNFEYNVDSLSFYVQEISEGVDDGRVAQLCGISCPNATRGVFSTSTPHAVFEFVNPHTSKLATATEYPKPSSTMGTRRDVSAVGISSPSPLISTTPSSLALGRAINHAIPGGDQVTDALILHNFLSSRGYSLDWSDEPMSRSRGWKCTAFVDGCAFGVGVGVRKVEARQGAAAHAMSYFRTHPDALPSRSVGSGAPTISE